MAIGIYLSIFLMALIGLVIAITLSYKIRNKKLKHKEVEHISSLIKEGANSYLQKQYKILAIVIVIVAILLMIFLNVKTGLLFLFGAILSGTSGYMGMMIATSANSRTTEDCEKSLNLGLKTAFSSGVVMGLTVVSLGLLGVIISYLIFKDLDVLFGFGFGASLIALFARVGGGIYTKAADVGADLVGKVEAGIPEDDPRNPATIADNVGDNVGDVAGMGADLFESYVQSIIAAMTLGFIFFASEKGIFFPLLIAGLGIVAAVLGTFFVRVKEKQDPHFALNKGIIASSVLVVIFSLLLVMFYLGNQYMNVFYVIVIGLVAGLIIGFTTEYYTSDHKKPVKSIALASETGPATNVIKGFSIGMKSTVIIVLVIVIAILASYSLAGLFGIAISAVGMLSTLGITLATDTYGPVADNAAGIAEMAKLKHKVRERAEKLDAVGNTTAAIGKGFAIGSAALTALALFSVYGEKAGIQALDILTPAVLSGLFIGALLPFIFSSLTMDAVGKTAFSMVQEVRRQFKNKDILKGKKKPDYKKPIEISTTAALRQMLVPGFIAVLTPVIIGIVLGKAALGGLLAGTTVTGFLLAITLSNAGGAWDNAKKYIEKGNLGGKGSDAHKAAVIGDTVGDPFKDTSGPSLNILIKLVAIVSLILVMIL